MAYINAIQENPHILRVFFPIYLELFLNTMSIMENSEIGNVAPIPS